VGVVYWKMDMREQMSKTCNEFCINPIKIISEHKTKLKVDNKTKNIEIVILSHIL
jgi:hypothetical protein